MTLSKTERLLVTTALRSLRYGDMEALNACKRCTKHIDTSLLTAQLNETTQLLARIEMGE